MKPAFPPEESIFSNVGLVGGLPSGSTASGVCAFDEKLLAQSFTALKYQVKQPVSEDAPVTVVNYNKQFGGLDYHDPDYKAEFELSVFGFILRTTTKEQEFVNAQDELTNPSPLERQDPQSWLKSAMMRKSKAIITHGRLMDEVSPEDFITKPYHKVQSPYKLVHTQSHERRGRMRIRGAQINIMLHKDYM